MLDLSGKGRWNSSGWGVLYLTAPTLKGVLYLSRKGHKVDVTMATSFPLSWWKEVKMVAACLLGKEVEATIVNPPPSKTRQLVCLME